MRLESFRVEHPNPLVQHYLDDFSSVAEFFTYDPHRREEFSRRYRYLQENWPARRGQGLSWAGGVAGLGRSKGPGSAGFDPSKAQGPADSLARRQALVDALEAYNRDLGCSQATLANLDQLRRKGTVCVITGQQAGVLTGPLYTIYKIITAIQLAHTLSQELGAPVVPVFWVASEDHDFAEVNHLNLLNRENQPVRLKLAREPGGKFSIGDLPVEEDVFALLEELAAQTGDTEFKEGVLALALEGARQARNLAHWFALTVTRLFSQFGLILIDPMDPQLRQLAKDIYREFLFQIGPVNAAVEQGQARLQAAGYDPALQPDPARTNLFVYAGPGHGERLPLMIRDGYFSLRGREQSWTQEEILALLEEAPDSFSPNVVLRPVAQDFLLPNLAYVGGPGEIAYYAQLKDVYPLFGMEMPMIYPRVNITLVEKYLAAYLEKYGLTFGEVFAGKLRDRQEEYLAAADQLNLEELFDEMREAFHTVYRQIIPRLVTLDANLKNICAENQKRVLHQVEQLEGKARQYHRKKYGEALRQFEKLSLNLLPDGQWQERVFNLFPYLIKYGPGLIPALVQLPLLADFNHKLIFLE